MSEIILTIKGIDPVALYGQHDSYLNLIRRAFADISITARGDTIKLEGAKKHTQNAKSKIEALVRFLRTGEELTQHTVEDVLSGDQKFEEDTSARSGGFPTLVHGTNGKVIKARTRNQKALIDSSETNDIVFAVGPAGTGKTYTAVALAVQALRNRLVRKIILTRPAVEAGENLGFLPGDLKDKVDPYLRPLYDALDDMIPPEKLDQFMTNRIIEVAPLAFMRGRTLDNAFIILDEAQNATSMQIKMFLTRLGPSAKCIITGDLSQIDLPHFQRSGLSHAMNILDGVSGIGIIQLTTEDVVRHRLVKAIINRYDADDARYRAEEEARREQEDKERAAKIALRNAKKAEE